MPLCLVVKDVQRDSGNSIFRSMGGSVRQQPMENRPAQEYSRMSNLEKRLLPYPAQYMFLTATSGVELHGLSIILFALHYLNRKF